MISQESIIDNFKELETTLMRNTVPILMEIGVKFKLNNIRNLKKKELVKRIIMRIAEVMQAKYKPQTPEQFKQISRMVLDSILPHFTKTTQNPKSGQSRGLQHPHGKHPAPNHPQTGYNDPLDELKLINMTNCICFGNYKRGNNLLIKCTNEACGKVFHHGCIPWPAKELKNFECPRCIILANDPLHEVEEILYEPSILTSGVNYTYKLGFSQFSKMNNSAEYGVEIRTLKMDGVHFFEQTWPDKCTIRVNNKTVKEVKPLHHNSSLKKRRDEKIFNRHMSKMGPNSLKIVYQNVQDGKNTKRGEDPKYIFSVLYVRRLSVPVLQERILSRNRLSIEASKRHIMSKFEEQKDLQISRIKVDLLCKITYTMIQNPARGENCSHIDCFNLKFFLQTMEQNSVRKWICPLCRKRCSKLVVDSYLEQILVDLGKEGRTEEKVFFRSDGSYDFNSAPFEVGGEGIGVSGGGKKVSGGGKKAKSGDKGIGKVGDGEADLEILSLISSSSEEVKASEGGGGALGARKGPEMGVLGGAGSGSLEAENGGLGAIEASLGSKEGSVGDLGVTGVQKTNEIGQKSPETGGVQNAISGNNRVLETAPGVLDDERGPLSQFSSEKSSRNEVLEENQKSTESFKITLSKKNGVIRKKPSKPESETGSPQNPQKAQKSQIFNKGKEDEIGEKKDKNGKERLAEGLRTLQVANLAPDSQQKTPDFGGKIGFSVQLPRPKNVQKGAKPDAEMLKSTVQGSKEVEKPSEKVTTSISPFTVSDKIVENNEEVGGRGVLNEPESVGNGLKMAKNKDIGSLGESAQRVVGRLLEGRSEAEDDTDGLLDDVRGLKKGSLASKSIIDHWIQSGRKSDISPSKQPETVNNASEEVNESLVTFKTSKKSSKTPKNLISKKSIFTDRSDQNDPKTGSRGPKILPIRFTSVEESSINPPSTTNYDINLDEYSPITVTNSARFAQIDSEHPDAGVEVSQLARNPKKSVNSENAILTKNRKSRPISDFPGAEQSQFRLTPLNEHIRSLKNQQKPGKTQNPDSGQNLTSLLSKRLTPAYDSTINSTMLKDTDYNSDYNFLVDFWKHYEKTRKTLFLKKNYQSFHDFNQSLNSLCHQDQLFSKKVELLYKFVKNRRKVNSSQKVVGRYNRILRGIGDQDWVYNDKNVNVEPRKRIKRARRENSDLILKGILRGYGFDEPSDTALIGLKGGRESLERSLRGNSLANAIEIL